jgi:hypothetical protein
VARDSFASDRNDARNFVLATHPRPSFLTRDIKQRVIARSVWEEAIPAAVQNPWPIKFSVPYDWFASLRSQRRK